MSGATVLFCARGCDPLRLRDATLKRSALSGGSSNDVASQLLVSTLLWSCCGNNASALASRGLGNREVLVELGAKKNARRERRHRVVKAGLASGQSVATISGLLFPMRGTWCDSLSSIAQENFGGGFVTAEVSKTRTWARKTDKFGKVSALSIAANVNSEDGSSGAQTSTYVDETDAADMGPYLNPVKKHFILFPSFSEADVNNQRGMLKKLQQKPALDGEEMNLPRPSKKYKLKRIVQRLVPDSMLIKFPCVHQKRFKNLKRLIDNPKVPGSGYIDKLYLQLRRNRKLLNRPSSTLHGLTPYHYALATKNMGAIRIMQNMGVDVTRSKVQWSPLYCFLSKMDNIKEVSQSPELEVVMEVLQNLGFNNLSQREKDRHFEYVLDRQNGDVWLDRLFPEALKILGATREELIRRKRILRACSVDSGPYSISGHLRSPFVVDHETVVKPDADTAPSQTSLSNKTAKVVGFLRKKKSSNKPNTPALSQPVERCSSEPSLSSRDALRTILFPKLSPKESAKSSGSLPSHKSLERSLEEHPQHLSNRFKSISLPRPNEYTESNDDSLQQTQSYSLERY